MAEVLIATRGMSLHFTDEVNIRLMASCRQKQAITWTNIVQYLRRQMMSLDVSELRALNMFLLISWYCLNAWENP